MSNALFQQEAGSRSPNCSRLSAQSSPCGCSGVSWAQEQRGRSDMRSLIRFFVSSQKNWNLKTTRTFNLSLSPPFLWAESEIGTFFTWGKREKVSAEPLRAVEVKEETFLLGDKIEKKMFCFVFFFLYLLRKDCMSSSSNNSLTTFFFFYFFFLNRNVCTHLYCEIGLRQISKLLFQKLECVYKMYISDPFFKNHCLKKPDWILYFSLQCFEA